MSIHQHKDMLGCCTLTITDDDPWGVNCGRLEVSIDDGDGKSIVDTEPSWLLKAALDMNGVTEYAIRDALRTNVRPPAGMTRDGEEYLDHGIEEVADALVALLWPEGDQA